ncbi:hypothetical protein FB45DRAFT_781610 [Roridomyces roridus]|uniref:F-box domain-containing protein n=1 Tax=Roridomyces roridus TaxID=1738132 RepID=A0AAD7G0C4_9AGAR|nr:hypothetical protein FB45DRAFT_781610 [Roridomyces roridus]
MFPAEVVEQIIDHVAENRATLTSSTLVSRAWHTRAKFWLFSSTPIRLVGVPDIDAFIATLESPLCTVHSHIRSLSLRQTSSNPSQLNHVIPVLVRLCNLTSLEIVAESALLSDEARQLLETSFPSLRHLLLHITFSTCAEAVRLVCSFPQLESLRLHARWIGSWAPHDLNLPRSLRTLDLDGYLGDALSWLLLCSSSPPLTCLQLREVATGEFGIVFAYLKTVAASLQSFKLSFLGVNAENEFLTFDDNIQCPELRALEITGRDFKDVVLMVHLLSRLDAPLLEEITFTNLGAVSSLQAAWTQLQNRLLAYPHLRKVTITTLPHFEVGIKLQLRHLYERGMLKLVLPEG